MKPSAQSRPPVPGLAVWCLAAACACSAPLPATAQQPRVPFGQDTHAFRRVLHDLGLKPLARENQIWENPNQTLVILLGDAPILRRLRLEEFVKQGGAVMVATDRQLHPFQREVFGVQVVDRQVRAPREFSYSYRGISECPFVVKTSEHPIPIMKGLTQVATNCPAFLAVRRDPEQAPLTVLASFPLGAYLTDRQLGGLLTIKPFAVAGTRDKGRMLILSDHSVFINDMILQLDNDNYSFACNCVEWLMDEGKRKQVLFVDEGTIRTDLEIPLEEPEVPDVQVPPVEALVPLINKLVASVEHENLFNRMLVEQLGPTRILKGVVLLLTAMLVAYGLVRHRQVRHRIEPTAPLFGQSLARLAPSAAIIEQRHQAMLQSGNLWEAARDLARAALGSGLDATPPAPGPKPAPPDVEVTGDWWRRWKLRALALGLWRLATSADPGQVTLPQFKSLIAQAREVKAALADGTLRLDNPAGHRPAQEKSKV